MSQIIFILNTYFFHITRLKTKPGKKYQNLNIQIGCKIIINTTTPPARTKNPPGWFVQYLKRLALSLNFTLKSCILHFGYNRNPSWVVLFIYIFILDSPLLWEGLLAAHYLNRDSIKKHFEKENIQTNIKFVLNK